MLDSHSDEYGRYSPFFQNYGVPIMVGGLTGLAAYAGFAHYFDSAVHTLDADSMAREILNRPIHMARAIPWGVGGAVAGATVKGIYLLVREALDARRERRIEREQKS